MEELISKLSDTNSALNGIAVMLGIIAIISVFAFMVLFGWYYDVTKKEEHTRLRKQIEREIKEDNNSNNKNN